MRIMKGEGGRVGIYRAFYDVSREILCFQRWKMNTVDPFREVIEFLLGEEKKMVTFEIAKLNMCHA